MIDDQSRAQRWHDTDHGADRAPPRQDTRFHRFVVEVEPDWVSDCWCCCELCNPDWESERWGGVRPNPFWIRARNRRFT